MITKGFGKDQNIILKGFKSISKSNLKRAIINLKSFFVKVINLRSKL